MRILAIETSCDETAVCVLEAHGRNLKSAKWRILSNIVASQVKIHAPWGGVVPNLAKREHQRNLPIILRKALKEAGLNSKSEIRSTKQIQNSKFKIPNIDLLAVTSGPGLEPALWVGINFSQELAKKWKKLLIGINHLEGHIFSVLLPVPKKILFPALALVVSGGHTELVLIEKPLRYKVIGQTLDDAAGEAFDKVARLLGLGYPGGPVIAKEAEKFQNPSFKFQDSRFKIQLPRPMINSKDYNFSFSGLKTAVLYKLKELGALTPEIKTEMAHEFQQAVIDVLIKKTIHASKEYRAKTIILGGGVAANKELRKQLQAEIAHKCCSRYLLNLLMPEMEFTGDNAAMIALAAYFRALKNKKIGNGHNIVADSNLRLK